MVLLQKLQEVCFPGFYFCECQIGVIQNEPLICYQASGSIACVGFIHRNRTKSRSPLSFCWLLPVLSSKTERNTLGRALFFVVRVSLFVGFFLLWPGVGVIYLANQFCFYSQTSGVAFGNQYLCLANHLFFMLHLLRSMALLKNHLFC